MLLHNKVEYELLPQVDVVNLSYKYGIKFGFFKVIRSIKKLVKLENPDVVVCFMAQNILLTGIAIKNIKVPFVVSERIDPAQVKRNFIFKHILNKIYERASLVIFQTKRAQNYFNEKIRKNSCIIGNPIKISCFKSSNTKHKIVNVGRMTAQKNQAMLLDVFKSIHDKYPDYTLTIYGDGPLRNELESKIKELGLEDSAFLPGVSNSIHKEMSDAEMFVLSSNFEGLSNALMEAMLMGLPSISTDCAGSDEIIVNNENGILIPVGDANQLYDAIENLINDKKLRNSISKNSTESMKKYEEKNIIDKWNSTIENVIESKK